MTQKEEIELSLKLGEVPQLDKLIAQLNTVKNISNEIPAKGLIPAVEKGVIDSYESLNKQIVKLYDTVRGSKTIEQAVEVGKKISAIADAQDRVNKTTTDFIEALKIEQQKLSEVNISLATLKQQKSQLDAQIKISIKNGKTEAETFKQQNQESVKLSVAIAALSEQKKLLTGENLKQQKETQNLIKEEKAAQGSIDQLRLVVNRLTKEYDALGTAQRKGTEGKELKKNINENLTQLKELEAGTGRFRLNVGNYESAFEGFLSKIPGGEKIKEITKGFTEVGEAIKGVAETAGESEAGVGAVGGALGGIAAVAGIVVGSLGLMATSFFRTTEGAKDLNLGIGALEGTFAGLLSAFNPFSDHFGEFVTQAVKGAKAGVELARVENEELEVITKLTKAYASYSQQLIINNQLSQDSGIDFIQREKALQYAVEQRIQSNLNEQEQIKEKLKLQNALVADEKATSKDRRAAALEAVRIEKELNDKRAEGIVVTREGEIQLFDLRKEKTENSFKIEEATNAALLKQQLLIAESEIKGRDERIKAAEKAAITANEVAESELKKAKQLEALATESVNKAGANDKLAAQRLTQATAARITAEENILAVQITNQERVEAIRLRFFRDEATLITTKVNSDKAGFDATINNEKKSFEERLANNKKFEAELKEAVLKEQQAFEQATGKTADFQKLINSKTFDDLQKNINNLGLSARAQKNVQTAILEFQKLFKEVEVNTEKIGEKVQDANDKIVKQTGELLAKNVTAYKAGTISISEFAQVRVELEKEQAIAIEDTRIFFAKKETDRQIVLAQGNVELVENLNKFKEQLEIEHVEILRNINVEGAKKDNQQKQDQIDLEKATSIRIATETIKDKEKLQDKIDSIDNIALKKRIENERLQITVLKTVGENTVRLEEQLQKDLTQLFDNTKKQREKRFNETIDDIKNGANALLGSVEKAYEKNAELVGNKLARQSENIQHQTALAAAGLNNTLGFEESQKVALEKKQDEDRQKAAKAAKLQSFFNLLAEYSKQNPNTAAAKALVQIELADVIAAKLEKGTEGTLGTTLERKGRRGGGVNRDGIIYGKRHSAGGVLIEAELEEAVLNRNAVAALGEDFIRQANKGAIPDNFFAKENEGLQQAIIINKKENPDRTEELLREMKSVRKAIEDKPVNNVRLDGLGNVINEEIKRGQRITTIDKRRRIG